MLTTEGDENMSSQLEYLKNKLEHAINTSETMEKLQEISYGIDEEIEKSYLKINKVNKHYKEYFDRQDRLEIISQIQEDLTSTYYNISQLELDILSENIYDYCCLMLHHIPKQKITRYILDKNAELYDSLSEEQIRKMTIEANIKVFKFLIAKFTKVLKKNNKMAII